MLKDNFIQIFMFSKIGIEQVCQNLVVLVEHSSRGFTSTRPFRTKKQQSSFFCPRSFIFSYQLNIRAACFLLPRKPACVHGLVDRGHTPLRKHQHNYTVHHITLLLTGYRLIYLPQNINIKRGFNIRWMTSEHKSAVRLFCYVYTYSTHQFTCPRAWVCQTCNVHRLVSLILGAEYSVPLTECHQESSQENMFTNAK